MVKRNSTRQSVADSYNGTVEIVLTHRRSGVKSRSEERRAGAWEAARRPCERSTTVSTIVSVVLSRWAVGNSNLPACYSTPESQKMPLKYTKTVEIVGEHRDAVNAVVFSPSGQYLASASHDGRILIWALDSGRALHRLTYHSPVLSLLWVGSPNQILAGCGNGRMLTISFDEVFLFYSCQTGQNLLA